jgi:hypothetical protein
MAKPITNRVKTSKTPVIRKDLEGGVVAEANNDGSIYVDKSVKKGSPLEKEAIAHEKVHIDQMERGDLNYDDDNVQWKGKSYPRSTMNEGAKQLPWEKEAYDKTKHMNNKKKTSPNKMTDADLVANNKQTHSKFNDVASAMPKQKSLTSATETESPTKMKATPITYKASALKRTVASKEFAATYGDSRKRDRKNKEIDPPKKTSRRGKSGGFVGTETTTTTPGSTTTMHEASHTSYDGPKDPNIYKVLGKELTSGFAKSKYGYDGNDVHEYETFKNAYNNKGQTDSNKSKTVVTPSTTSTSFKADIETKPGTPGKESVYQMGGWEAANQKSRGNIEYSAGKQNNRRRQRDSKKWDRYVDKGKTLYDNNGVARDMDKGKADYMRDQAKSNPNFYKQTGVNSGGTESTLDTKGKVSAKGAAGEGLVDLDNKTGLLKDDVVKSTANLKGSSYKDLKMPKKINGATEELTPRRTRDTPAGYNTTNKNKSAFKMNGYGSKRTKK